jgi:cell division protein FtsA
VREGFELLKRRLDEGPYLSYLGNGIFITGGCSLLGGIDHLAEEIFEMPAHVAHAQTTWGVTSAVEDPQFSTAIGLVKFAQVMHTDRPPRGLGRIFGKLFSGMR